MEELVTKFVAQHNPKVYLLTPCFGGSCFVNYVHSLIETVTLFRQLQIPLQIEFCKNDSLVSRARNNLVAKAMSDPAMTHIVFIDNDIKWNSSDLLKLLLSEKPVIGGAYPIKKYNWNMLLQKSPQEWIDRKNNSILQDVVDDENMIRCNLVTYNVNHLSQNIDIEKNLTRVKHLATGFLMIQRTVLEQLMLAHPAAKYVDDVGFLQGDENSFAYALFDCAVVDKHYYSEDWLFCNRWRDLGGDVWLDVSVQLIHTGIENFNGSFLSTIV